MNTFFAVHTLEKLTSRLELIGCTPPRDSAPHLLLDSFVSQRVPNLQASAFGQAETSRVHGIFAEVPSSPPATSPPPTPASTAEAAAASAVAYLCYVSRPSGPDYVVCLGVQTADGFGCEDLALFSEELERFVRGTAKVHLSEDQPERFVQAISRWRSAIIDPIEVSVPLLGASHLASVLHAALLPRPVRIVGDPRATEAISAFITLLREESDGGIGGVDALGGAIPGASAPVTSDQSQPAGPGGDPSTLVVVLAGSAPGPPLCAPPHRNRCCARFADMLLKRDTGVFTMRAIIREFLGKVNADVRTAMQLLKAASEGDNISLLKLHHFLGARENGDIARSAIKTLATYCEPDDPDGGMERVFVALDQVSASSVS